MNLNYFYADTDFRRIIHQFPCFTQALQTLYQNMISEKRTDCYTPTCKRKQFKMKRGDSDYEKKFN